MSDSQVLNTAINQATNAELIDLINELRPIINPKLLSQIKQELKKRQINYQHLLNRENELKITQPLRLIDNNLFELKIPKPPMVGTFYRKVKKLAHYLNSSPILEGKQLVTFDYILDQFYLTTKEVKVIKEDDIKDLDANSIFIGFRNHIQTFPNTEILSKLNHLDTLIIINKGPYYRGLKDVLVLRNNVIVDQLNI